MFRKTESSISKFLKKLKYYRSSKLIKALVIISTASLLIVYINSEENKLKKYINNTSYSVYGESVKTIRDIYDKLNNITLCRTNNLVDIEILRDNKYLKLQNTILQDQIKLLKSKMKLIDHRDYSYVTAIVTQVTYPKDEISLVLSAGETDGIKVGNIVIDENGVVGRIASVTDNYSLVSVIGNENVKISALVIPSQAECIVGKKIDRNHLELNYLNDIDKISDGDKVISSGKDGSTPYGITIGTIEKKDGRASILINMDIKRVSIVKIISHG